MTTSQFLRCADLIDQADGLLITAGAGMGVDSGLPDFRGGQGFWKAYPALGRAKMRFDDIASPAAFKSDPALAWGFYGHRLKLYRETVPHDGFRMLFEIAKGMPHGGFVFTSNVDGQFQKAGFPEERIVECHGTIHYLQCLERCTDAIRPADSVMPDVDAESCRMISEPPRCPDCGALARPVVLMFYDWNWAEGRTRLQTARLADWRRKVERPVVIEIGAGGSIPTVREFGHSMNAPLIRINPTECQVPHRRDVGIAVGALEGITGIWRAMMPSGSDTLPGLDFTGSGMG